MKILPAIRSEGGLFAPDLFDQLLNEELPGQKPRDFGVTGHQSLTNEIAATFNDALALWKVFSRRLERLPQTNPATRLTRSTWMIPFLSLLGFELQRNRRAYVEGGVTFAISHRAGAEPYAPPVHIVGARQDLGRLSSTGRPRLAPHSLLQEFLNRTEALWGIVTNGTIIRLLRDSTYIRRQCYVEFDLNAIFEQHLFQDFAVLYRLLHRTRFPIAGGDAHRCLLEQYYQYSVEQGGRVREHLREGVESCIKQLGNGFLAHTKNERLRRRLLENNNERISPEKFYQELLHLVYRFLFLLVSEARGLISQNPLYLKHYSVSRLRQLVDNPAAYTRHHDLWLSFRLLWKLFSDDKPAPQLKDQPLATLLEVPVLNGALFEELVLDGYWISNKDLLKALRYLFFYQESESAPSRPVNYAALDVEELGSVYESLLDYHPRIRVEAQAPRFELVYGSQRRSTGSYYTPSELVTELIHSALDPVMAERMKAAGKEKEQALLSIKVVDPAVGSGHFLLAAARRMGKELARLRTGEEEPPPEQTRQAIRDVITHCIYGVDKNPLAVELCKVAMWIESHTPGKPLTFLDHRIRCGDSLVGVLDLSMLKNGIPDEAFKPVTGDDRVFVSEVRKINRKERTTGQRSLLSRLDPIGDIKQLSKEAVKLDRIADDTPQAIRQKQTQFARLQQKAEAEQMACHLWTAAFFQPRNRQIAPDALITTETLNHYLESGSGLFLALAAATELAHRYRFFHWPLEFPEVFAEGGFDVVLGNPPFMGGLKISGVYGDHYRRWLQVAFAPFSGTADLCAAFFRQAFRLLKPGGRLGMIATNTLGQGDTRESGLAVILKKGGAITFARRFVKWPGQANVEVNLVALHKPAGDSEQRAESGGRRAGSGERPKPLAMLDDQPVDFISSRLDDMPEAEPRRLKQNQGKAFQGDIVRGIGFVLEPREAEQLIAKDPRNAECLFPYLNGQDLNSHPEQKPSRYVICFHDWPLEKAQEYPDLLRIVEERVKPEREKLKNRDDIRDREHWWLFARYRTDMRLAIEELEQVLIRSRVSEIHSISFVPKGYVYGDATVIFAFDDDYHFSLLQSGIHEEWIRKQASSLRTDVRYTPTDCFETFPFPLEEYQQIADGDKQSEKGNVPPFATRHSPLTTRHSPFAEAAHIGAEYHEHRRQIMLARQLGLTKTYNLFHDPACTDSDIQRLRELHAEMDRAIAKCYGWEDLDLQHGFYENERGKKRFTISQAARREVLRRLVALNLEVGERENKE